MENRLVISGVVDSKPQTRITPAGIPISRFVLRHRSEQSEAGMRRQIQCTIGVVAAGAGLQEAIKHLHQGSEVSVAGFLGRANSRTGEHRLVVHATAIKLISATHSAP
ncbi:MAG TPA: primosomal replication protein N [Gammaproteobacteria bacterium]